MITLVRTHEADLCCVINSACIHKLAAIRRSFTPIFIVAFQPSEEQVKEATDYCFQMLEKMDKARLDGDYHEVTREPLKNTYRPVKADCHQHNFKWVLPSSLQVVKICRDAIDRTEPVLADTHIYLLRMWSTLSEVQAYLQYFNDAATYSRKMVEGYM